MLDLGIDALNLFSMDSSAWLIAADVSLFEVWSTRLYNIILVVLGLGFVIFVHELGHFLAAKTFGVKCEKFYVGFDVPIKIGPIRLPAKLAHVQWGETEYGIGIIPLGGYVRMLGQDDDPRKLKEEAERIRSENPNANSDDPNRILLDPRSFPAKPVYARMIIISAGVVMNLIFGVLMAAVAFGLGVPYDPAVIGAVVPGDPAWVNGVRAGDKVVQVGSLKGKELSFSDMRQKVALAGIRDPKSEVILAVARDGVEQSFRIVGTTVHSAPDSRIKLLALGVRPAGTTKLSSKAAFREYLTESGIRPGELEPNDVIIALNGVALRANQESELPSADALEELLHPRLNDNVTMTVRRTKDKSTHDVDVTLTPIALKTWDISFAPETVNAVQNDSVAAKAGVRAGDKLLSFNGKPIEDALHLPYVVAGMAGQTVNVEFEGEDATRKKLEWTVPDKFVITSSPFVFHPSGFELPGSGFVYRVSNVVQSVTTDSLAAKGGLVAGDTIKQVKFQLKTAKEKEFYEEIVGSKSMLERIPVDDVHSVQFFHQAIQYLPEGLTAKIDFEREGKLKSCEVAISNHPTLHDPERGLRLESLRKKYEANSFGQAISLGTAEVWKRLGDVLEFLQLVATGKAFNAFGGPGTIAVTANEAASQGIPSLLMFLTLLSANLAIVNFLPIPALDGGHMVFLTAEAVRGKPVDEELQMRLTIAGVVGLLCLMGWAIFNDYMHLSRYFGG